MIDDKIRLALRSAMPINLPGLSGYPDFLAFGLALLITSKIIRNSLYAS